MLQVFQKSRLRVCSFLKLCFTLLFCLNILSCNIQKDSQYELLINSLKKLDSGFNHKSFYVIIPNQGCDGCITFMEDFVIKNHEISKNISFVFTRINSKKLLKLKMGKQTLESKNIFLDMDNIISFPDKSKEIYPMILCMKEGHVSEIFYQSPFQEGIDLLVQKLKQHEY